MNVTSALSALTCIESEHTKLESVADMVYAIQDAMRNGESGIDTTANALWGVYMFMISALERQQELLELGIQAET